MALTQRLRTSIALSASLAFVGIALCVVDAEGLGGPLAALSLVSLGWSVHRFGRTGADAPIDFTVEPE